MVALGVSACGGKDKKPEPQKNPPAKENAAEPQKPQNQAPNTPMKDGDKLSGYLFSSQDQKQMQKISDASLAHVVVAGKRFDFQKAKTDFAPGFSGNETEALVVNKADWLKHVRLGLVAPNGSDGLHFVVGNTTKELPATGKAQYQGSAYLVQKKGDGFAGAPFAASVDFAAKSVAGVIGSNKFSAKKK